MSNIGKPQPEEYANFFRRYIDMIGEQDILTFLSQQQAEYIDLLKSIPEDKMTYAYQDGKWTVAEVLGHVNDVERVMGYRAFRFSRNDKTVIPGFNDHLYVNNGDFAKRSRDTFIREYDGLRSANLEMMRNFSEDQSMNTGKANEVFFSVRALAYIIAGHLEHHINILTERYHLGK